MKNIYNMKLHERIVPRENSEIQITRVAGGWIYAFYRLDCNAMATTFIPYHNEFSAEEIKPTPIPSNGE